MVEDAKKDAKIDPTVPLVSLVCVTITFFVVCFLFLFFEFKKKIFLLVKFIC